MKRRSILRWLLMLFWPLTALTALAVEAHGAGGADFYPDEFRWEKRLLIVYAPEAAAAKLKTQRELWAGEKKGIIERDLLVFEWEGANRLPEKARERYGIDPGEFTVLLVGKDGGVKLVVRDPVGPKRIYPLIDAMPMRQREMEGE